MSEYQKIEDFRKGFLGQSNAKRYTISARLALRALPAALAELTRENARDQKLALFCCRSVLTTAVTGALNKPKLIESFLHGGLNYQAETLGVRLGRDISFEDAEKHDISSDYGSYTDSINVADLAFEAARNANGFPHSHMGGNMSAFYKYAIDDTLRDSAKEPGDVFSSLLWNNNGIPDRFSSDWLKFCAYVEKHNEWSFWRDWYQGFLDGKPLDWELQKEIALIPNSDWKKGPEWIAGKIEEIKDEFLAQKLPQAETIHFNEESTKFYATPSPVAKPDLLGATLAQISDAITDVLADPSNGLSERSYEVRVLRRTVAKYGNDPQRVEMDSVSVYKSLTRQLLSTELPQSEENLALKSAVDEAARGIRATNPEVAKNRRILSEQTIKELPQESRQELAEALPILVAMTERGLPEEWEHDIPNLVNDAIYSPGSFAPPLPGADEATRIFSRVSKMAKLMRNSSEIVERIHNSPWYKATSFAKLGITIVGWITGIVRLGLRMFF